LHGSTGGNYVVSYERIKKLGFNTSITVQERVNELVKALAAIQFKTPYSNV
jgi:hypothetical protein